MAERRVSVRFSAEISNFRRSMEEAATAVQKAKQASEDAGKAADKSAEEIQAQALAHHEAAKAAGLQYDNTGQLVTMNGKAVSSQQAATHGLQTFSAEAYLAGRAAVAAGEDAEAAAKVAAEAEKKAAEAVKARREAMEELGPAAVVSGTAVLAGVGLAVKAYADFDKQMSSVDAATHETKGNMDLLRQAAIDAGADTAFSAGEAAQGIEELAKAGVSTKDILGGGLNGALALAAAGSLDVGTAAEIAASALTQFKLSGDKVPHIADLLAAGAGKAQGSVEDLGAALNQSGLVAASTGLTIEEATGALSAFASAGLTGSDAGTSFKTMLMSLNPNSKEAAQLMDELGIHAYDAQGKFVGMSEYAGILQDALKGMSDEQRNATLKTLFGSDAVRAANVLYEQGAAGINKWEGAVNDAGFAADTAARMQNNLAGDLEKLGGSFDTVLIQSGSGANEVLRGLVQGLEGFVDTVGKVPAPALAVGTGLAAVVGGAALVGGTILTVIPKIRDMRDAFNTLAPAGGRARGALVGVGKATGGLAALGAATLILAKLAESDYMSKIDTGMGKVADSLAEVSTNGPDASTALDGLFKDRSGGDLINTVTDLDSAIKRTFNRDGGQQFNDWGESIVNGLTGVKGSSQILGDQFERLDKGLAELVSGGKASDAAKSFDEIKKAAEDQGVSIDDLKAKFPQYADALRAAEAATKTAAAEGKNLDGSLTDAGAAAEAAAKQSEDIQKALEDVGVAADGTVANLDKFTQALFNAGLLEMDARSATAAHQAAIDATSAAIVNAKKAIEDKLVADGMGVDAAKALADEQYNLGGALNKSKSDFDLTTEAGRVLNDQFQSIASTGMAEIEAKAKDGAGQPELQKNLSATYESLKTAGVGMGLTAGAADDLARRVLGVPDKADINTWMSSEAKRMAEQTKGAIDAIPKNVTVNTTFNETTIQRVIRQLSGDAAPVGAGTVLAPKKSTGGILRGYSDGGQLPSTGPGTGVTDGFLGIDSIGLPVARLDANEWIINGRSSDRYSRELAAINAGTFPKLPGYANGGREYTAQSLGHGSYRETPVSQVTYQIDAKPGLAYEYAKDIARQTATRTRDLSAAYGA